MSGKFVCKAMAFTVLNRIQKLHKLHTAEHLYRRSLVPYTILGYHVAQYELDQWPSANKY